MADKKMRATQRSKNHFCKKRCCLGWNTTFHTRRHPYHPNRAMLWTLRVRSFVPCKFSHPRGRISPSIIVDLMKRAATTQSPPEPLVVDGSHGEGGGQILRNSMTFACIFQRSLRVHSIRAGRSKPGLKKQHLVGLRLCAQIAGGTLEGDKLQSSEISYHPLPEEIENESSTKTWFEGAVDTAGSICLVLQAALPLVLFRHTNVPMTELILKGGTNADMAPQYDYWERVFLPMFRKAFQLRESFISPRVIVRGYYPLGKGVVKVKVPTLLRPLLAFDLTDRGIVEHIYIRSFHAGKLQKYLAAKLAKAAEKCLRQELDLSNIELETEIVTEHKAEGSGLGILLVATTSTGCKLGGSTIAQKREKAEDAGIRAAKELVTAIQEGGCVDEWLQDQVS